MLEGFSGASSALVPEHSVLQQECLQKYANGAILEVGRIQMATLQVRDIDDRLYEALRARARAEHRSVSQEVVFILEDHLSKSAPSSERQTELFLGLTGAWEGTETADQLVASIRGKRKNSNRFGSGRVTFD